MLLPATHSRLSHTPLARVALATLAAPAVIMLGGCAGSTSPTDGYAVNLLIFQRQTNLAIYYALRATGDLSYNAGTSILSTGDPTGYPLWTTTLTREQAAPIVAWLKEFSEPDSTTDEASLPIYTVCIVRPDKVFDQTTKSNPTPWLIELRRRFDSVQRQFRTNTLPYPDIAPVR